MTKAALSVRPVFVRAGKLAVVLMLVLATGGHWFLLQSVAWVQMTARFAQQESLGDALQKTFDGKHPCQLCKFVKRGKAAEREREQKAPDLKIDFQLVNTAHRLFAPSPILHFTPFLLEAEPRPLPPPLPPPRVA